MKIIFSHLKNIVFLKVSKMAMLFTLPLLPTEHSSLQSGDQARAFKGLLWFLKVLNILPSSAMSHTYEKYINSIK